MPTFDRTTIVRGPCKVTYDSQTFYSKAGVVLTTTNSTFDKETDAYGVVSKSKTDFTIVVEFEPVGEIEAGEALFFGAGAQAGQERRRGGEDDGTGLVEEVAARQDAHRERFGGLGDHRPRIAVVLLADGGREGPHFFKRCTLGAAGINEETEIG
jgi:hypothetical protein